MTASPREADHRAEQLANELQAAGLRPDIQASNITYSPFPYVYVQVTDDAYAIVSDRREDSDEDGWLVGIYAGDYDNDDDLSDAISMNELDGYDAAAVLAVFTSFEQAQEDTEPEPEPEPTPDDEEDA